MKSFSRRLSGCVILSLLVSACSSVNYHEKETIKKADNDVALPHSAKDTIDLTAQDPLQKKALELKGLPNQYRLLSQDVALSDAVQNLFNQGNQLIKQNQLNQAQKVFITLTQQEPSLSGSWVQLAYIAQLQDNLSLTEKYLTQAIKVNNANYMAHNRLGILYALQGRFQLALAQYDFALNSWPAFAEARLNRGILYDIYLGKKTEALYDYQVYQALQAEPEHLVKGWIIDLERQIDQQKNEKNEDSSLTGGVQ